MRIVVFGDFQLLNTPRSMTRQAIADIRRLKPDYIVTLGDYGDEAKLGHPQAAAQIHGLLSNAGAPVYPLLGNHDLQYENGHGTQSHGVMENAFCETFGVNSTFFVKEHKTFRVFGISLDAWEMDPPYCLHECHVSDGHFTWIEEMFGKRPGVPVIMLTHAPSIGCGLKMIPQVHGRSTNTYMDQNTDPMRWIRLTEHPEIVLWLSAHYHIGHDHKRSLSIRNGVAYALTGVHGATNRDGTRHTRVIDVQNGVLELKTFDHSGRSLREIPDYKIHLTDTLAMRSALYPRVSPPAETYCLQQFQQLGNGGIQTLRNGHLLVSTADNYLWEVDPVWDVVYGSLHYYGTPLIDYCISGQIVWRAFGTQLAAVHMNDPWRFNREHIQGNHNQDIRFQLSKPADSLQPIPGGGVCIQIGEETYAYTADL